MKEALKKLCTFSTVWAHQAVFGSTDESQFKKLRFKKESRFKKYFLRPNVQFRKENFPKMEKIGTI